MVNNERSDIVFSLSDDMYINPEKYFPAATLLTLQPYHIFTGVGVVATVENDRFERRKYFLMNLNKAKKLQRKKTGIKVIQVEECFFAYVVRQNREDEGFQIEK